MIGDRPMTYKEMEDEASGSNMRISSFTLISPEKYKGFTHCQRLDMDGMSVSEALIAAAKRRKHPEEEEKKAKQAVLKKEFMTKVRMMETLGKEALDPAFGEVLPAVPKQEKISSLLLHLTANSSCTIGTSSITSLPNCHSFHRLGGGRNLFFEIAPKGSL